MVCLEQQCENIKVELIKTDVFSNLTHCQFKHGLPATILGSETYVLFITARAVGAIKLELLLYN